jgi:hypothetical protein
VAGTGRVDGTGKSAIILDVAFPQVRQATKLTALAARHMLRCC